MTSEIISKISRSQDLTYDEMSDIMDKILHGKSSTADIASFLGALREKGESDDELLAMLDKMQELAIHIAPKCHGKIIDICGTGGDKMHTFNISTAASFVIAAGGVNVAKHGNRSVSGISGSADIFEYFGYDLGMEPSKAKDVIEKFGIGFLFAQKFHPAMRNVAEARKVLGGRTAFNLLGPLSNPAGIKNQLVGVFAPEYLLRVINLLKQRGSENIMTVISNDGLDELSITSKNQVKHFKNGELHEFVLDPSELELTRADIRDIQVTTKDESIKAFVTVLNGTAKKPLIDITALNAAAGLIIGGVSNRFDEAVPIALEIIKDGKSFSLFERFIQDCGNVDKIYEVLRN